MADSLPPVHPQVLVCPECQYGFRDEQPGSYQLTCPRPECGHQWEAIGETGLVVLATLRRQGFPELHVLGGASPQVIRIAEGPNLIGRDKGARLLLDNLSVSRQHAVLTRAGDELWIEDLKSAHGTFVNGQSISARTRLGIGDQVIIGGVKVAVAIRFEAAPLSDPEAMVQGLPEVVPQEQVYLLDRDRLTLGRGDDRDVVLPNPMVSRRHALLECREGQYYLSDAQSQIGTYVNGKAIIRSRLALGDLIQIGPYLFRFEKGLLRSVPRPRSMAVAAVKLRRQVNDLVILDDVSVILEPGKFVGVLGPSGAGKSTLLGALLGLVPLSGGQVEVNGESLRENYDRLRHHLGYVPQDDIIHTELTCRQALSYAAALRLPRDLSPAECAELVDQTLADLDLAERGDVVIGRLSGGQRKRASIGVELLSKPGILYLDEPTSGLDPATEGRLMQRFARLARQGRTVVCTTHVMENIDLFDKLVVLARGGKLAFFGPPDAAKDYFEVKKFTTLYDRLEEARPEEWQAKFRGHPLYPALSPTPMRETPARSGEVAAPPVRVVASAIRQGMTLTRRFSRILLADRQNLALLLAQPLIIGGLICLVCEEWPLILFLLVIAGLWFGCSNAAQQLVKERSIYRRERMINLRLDSYLLSKFLPLAVVSTAQATLMLALVCLFERWEGNLFVQWSALVLGAGNGAALGLIVSALASSGDKAMAMVPLTLLPQIIFAGFMVPLSGMNGVTLALTKVVVARWSNQAMEAAYLEGKEIQPEMMTDLSLLRPLGNLYPDYNMNRVEERARFLQDHGGETIRKNGVMLFSFVALGGFLLLQLAVVGVCLRVQDPV